MTASQRLEERASAFRHSLRFLNGHGPRAVQAELLALAQGVDAEVLADSYGSGAVIEELEAQVAALLGKAAAVFMPSGTMAQQIALRLHAERARCHTVAFHPTCHLELHEQAGYRRLHGLEACLVGQRHLPLTRGALDGVSEPVAALLLELPQRELGGILPSWSELGEQVAWARERGVALHLDGARLWESAPFYGRPYAEIASLFDSVYVSFYKSLGAIAGAALAGSQELIAEARLWQRRHGGNLVSMYPFVLSARAGLTERLERMTAYCERAKMVASTLGAIPGARVTPDPPHTNLMHVYLPVDAERLLDESAALARATGVALFTRTRSVDVPGYCAVEISIGDAASAITDAELESLATELVDRARPAHDRAAAGPRT